MSARERLIAYADGLEAPASGGINIAAAASTHVLRNLYFAEVALRDFVAARDAWNAARDEFQAWLKTPAAGPQEPAGVTARVMGEEVTPREIVGDGLDLYERHAAGLRVVDFRIDAYYVFARILFDRIVVLINLALPRTGGIDLGDSHSKLEALLPQRCADLGIELPEPLRAQIADLSARVTDFRDDYVVHLTSPRAMRGGLGFTLDGSSVYASVGWINPRDSDEHVTSSDPHDLHPAILAYLESVIDLLESARSSASGDGRSE